MKPGKHALFKKWRCSPLTWGLNNQSGLREHVSRINCTLIHLLKSENLPLSCSCSQDYPNRQHVVTTGIICNYRMFEAIQPGTIGICLLLGGGVGKWIPLLVSEPWHSNKQLACAHTHTSISISLSLYLYIHILIFDRIKLVSLVDV